MDKLTLGYLNARNGIRGFMGKSEKGQNTTEYGIFIAGIIIVVLLAIAIFSGALERLFNKVADLIGGG